MSEAWIEKLRDPVPWSAPRPLPKLVDAGDICVRLYRAGDAPLLFAAINDYREALLPWMVWSTTDHQSVDDTIFYVERFRRAYEKPDCLDFPMGIFDSENGAVVGGTGFHHIVPSQRSAEIGYWIRGDQHGKGICTRAIGALMSAGFRAVDQGGWGFRRLTIVTDVENVASRRVCEKLGLRLETHARAERYFEPKYRDIFGFAALRDEWDFLRNRAKPDIGWNAG